MIALLAAIGLAGAAQTGPNAALVDALTRWAECTAVQTLQRATGPGSREAVAEAAAAACIEHERRVEALTVAESNAETAASQMRALRAQVRELNLAHVDRARGQAPPANNGGARYGRCVVGRALDWAGGPEPAEALAERAIAACAEEETAALAEAVPDRDPATIETVRQALRGRVMEIVTHRIAEARAGR